MSVTPPFKSRRPTPPLKAKVYCNEAIGHRNTLRQFWLRSGCYCADRNGGQEEKLYNGR